MGGGGGIRRGTRDLLTLRDKGDSTEKGKVTLSKEKKQT